MMSQWRLIYLKWDELWNLIFQRVWISCPIVWFISILCVSKLKVDRKLEYSMDSQWFHSERFVHDNYSPESFTYWQEYEQQIYYAYAIDSHRIVRFDTCRSFDVYHMLSLLRMQITSQTSTSEKRVWDWLTWSIGSGVGHKSDTTLVFFLFGLV